MWLLGFFCKNTIDIYIAPVHSIVQIYTTPTIMKISSINCMVFAQKLFGTKERQQRQGDPLIVLPWHFKEKVSGLGLQSKPYEI